MKRGYVHLWRKFQSHSLWQEKRKFSRAEAWIDMILQANGTDKNVMFDGRSMVVKRGQLLTSERKLAERWGWSKTKTRDFLNGLQKPDHTIEKESDRKKTLITILNYDIYNPLYEAKKTIDIEEEKTTERPQKDHRLAPTNKDKEGNKKVNLYIAQIIEHWNSKKIKNIEDRETDVKKKTIQKIRKRLKDYSINEILEAINNYTNILHDDNYFFSHKWQLWEFLDRGLINFLTKNKPFENWLKNNREYKPSQVGEYHPTQYSENEMQLIPKIDAEYKRNLEKIMKEEGWKSEDDIDYFKVPTPQEFRERRLREIKEGSVANV